MGAVVKAIASSCYLIATLAIAVIGSNDLSPVLTALLLLVWAMATSFLVPFRFWFRFWCYAVVGTATVVVAITASTELSLISLRSLGPKHFSIEHSLRWEDVAPVLLAGQFPVGVMLGGSAALLVRRGACKECRNTGWVNRHVVLAAVPGLCVWMLSLWKLSVGHVFKVDRRLFFTAPGHVVSYIAPDCDALFAATLDTQAVSISIPLLVATTAGVMIWMFSLVWRYRRERRGLV